MSTLITLVVTLGIFGLVVLFGLLMTGVALWRVRQAMAGATALAQPAFTSQQWGMALVGIITGTDDYRTWSPEAPRKMLAGSWSIVDAEWAHQQIEGLLATEANGDAWVFDRVRACHLSRASAGALYIEQDASWKYIYRAGRELQAGFASFVEVGDAYLRAKNAWLSSRGFDTDDGTENKVEALRQGAWLSIPFRMGLPS